MRSFLLACLLAINLVATNAANGAEYQLAINTPTNEDHFQKYIALGAYLSDETGHTIVPVSMPPSRIGRVFEMGNVLMAIMNPVSSVEVVEKNRAKPIATLKIGGLTKFAGVIFAKKGAGIQSIKDVKGKNVLAYQPSSAGGYVFQAYYLLSNGIDLKKDLASLRHTSSQNNVVAAVQSGRIDVGFVRTGLLETMAKEGKIKLDEFVIIDKKTDDIPLLHSTPPYPEWFFLVSGKLDAGTIEKLRAALLKLKPDHPAAKAAGIDGFVKPLPLGGVRNALNAVKPSP